MGTLLLLGIAILLGLTIMDYYRELLKKRCPNCSELVKTSETKRECIESELIEEDPMSRSITLWVLQGGNHRSKLKWNVDYKCGKCGNEWNRTIVEVRAWKDRYKTIMHGMVWCLVVLAVSMVAFKLAMIMFK